MSENLPDSKSKKFTNKKEKWWHTFLTSSKKIFKIEQSYRLLRSTEMLDYEDKDFEPKGSLDP